MTTNRKHSKKRTAILDLIRSVKSHPSADWVYETLRPSIPDLSLGTVYRNIAMFKAEGQIISVGVVNGEERFDGNVSEHTHFVCLNCGAVLDIDEDLSPTVNAEVGERNGVEVSHHQLTFYGYCEKCKHIQPPSDGSYDKPNQNL
jgi:Fur family peroxide stress response transcriptional regulator